MALNWRKTKEVLPSQEEYPVIVKAFFSDSEWKPDVHMCGFSLEKTKAGELLDWDYLEWIPWSEINGS